MKNKLSGGGLFGLLARQYLLFSLALLAITAAVTGAWNLYMNRLWLPTDWAALLADPALAAGRYESLRRYLDGGSAFAIYDGSGALTWASAGGFDPALTPGEQSCIPLLGNGWQVDAYSLTDQAGQARYLLVAHSWTDEGEEQTRTALLDGDYQVTMGGLGDGKTGYTPAEYAYLTGARFAGSYLSRALFTGGTGETHTLLLREAMATDAQYQALYRRGGWIWLLALPLYLAVTALFILRLRRRIARPLLKLNEAVEAQAAGRDLRVGDCGGPREIRRIGESFDRFAALLAESEAERRRLDEGRQKLIADISHDIRTPVTVISGAIDAVCSGKVPPAQQEQYLRMIQRKAASLAELTEAFHEYSKAGHPRFELHPRPVDLGEFLRTYLAGRYDEIDLAGFSLEPAIPEQPVRCLVDEPALRRALDNLLNNALRHNRLGTVLYVELEAGEGEARIRVADNGAGIPPERRRQIFEPFVTGSAARSGAGSGLGLAITRRILEKHGGSIALDPRPAPGRTTEFLLTLPLAGAE